MDGDLFDGGGRDGRWLSRLEENKEEKKGATGAPAEGAFG